ncbi:glycosyltransferase [Demequina rhizosphaerae]|uniref:glycosyltransferase n=1 Tax=Demequina rhizosphaerae TaxID=1638985 RepID=UPI00078597EF|nr:glycosyltransferase [Demequina rhizosphaerae]
MSGTPDANDLVVVGINYPPERTGIGPYTGALARALAARGRAVRVVTAQPHYPEWEIYEGYRRWTSDEDDAGVAVHRVLHYVPRRPQGIPRLLSEITLGARSALAPWGRTDAVLLVSPALFSSAIARLRARLTHRDAELAVWIQDLYGRGQQETSGGGAVAKILHAVEGGLLRGSDRVIVIHDRFKRAVVEDYGVDPDKVSVVRNWTHLKPHAPIDRAAARRERGWADETVILHAGNMGVKQGLEHVVAAARRAEERGESLRFVMLGDGGERARLEEAAEGLGNLDFLAPLDDEAFRGALAAADILLVHEAPGVSEMAVPSKLTSYFDAGRPVLAATDPAGVTADEVRSADAGVVVASGDPDALVDGALEIASDASRADALGANGRAYREAVLAEDAAIDAFAAVLGLDETVEVG